MFAASFSYNMCTLVLKFRNHERKADWRVLELRICGLMLLGPTKFLFNNCLRDVGVEK